MNTLTPLHCQSPSGEHFTFFYLVNKYLACQPTYWEFSVRRTTNEPYLDMSYHVKVIELDATTAFIRDINNENAEWAKKKGISESIFPVIMTTVGKKIMSSNGGPGERQTECGINMWKRFCSTGIARYDSDSRRYVYIPTEQF